MQDMRREKSVTHIRTASTARARAERRMRDLAAAARMAATATAPAFPEEPPRGGRAWLNGSELGGYDRRYAHLTRAYE
jgi:hypothetical protein